LGLGEQSEKGTAMVNGLYSAASGLNAAEQNHEVVSQNLANANVPGYRRRALAFESFAQTLNQTTQPGTAQGLKGVGVAKAFSTFNPGPMQHTGSPFDLAVQGDSFFVLQGPNGPLYTRNGTFQLNSQGQMQSQNGLLVSGTGGPITIPSTAKQIVIGSDGSVVVDQVPVGQMQLARFPDANALVPVGTTVFQAPQGVQPQPSTDKVLQGYHEASNVQAVNEMVSMIAGMRQFEASQRALRAISDAIQQNTRPQAA
jgi:flagellar basal-body rod protein FlgF